MRININSIGVVIIFSIILALMVIFNHRSNITRLLSGEEKQLSFKK